MDEQTGRRDVVEKRTGKLEDRLDSTDCCKERQRSKECAMDQVA